jgi:peptidoglycan-N-acetylglucosamine deacetylase
MSHVQAEGLDPEKMPLSCRRKLLLTFWLTHLPALGVVLCCITGHGLAAAVIFCTVFALISLGTVWPRSALFGPLVTSFHSPDAVCLTLDDGPDPVTTPQVLRILAEQDAKAVFFLIGKKAARHPELVQQIQAAGHEIGNHSQTHPAAWFWALPPWSMWREVAQCQQTLRRITGQQPQWFRPPVGHHNVFLAAILRTLGLRMMIWNARGYDAVARTTDVVMERLKPGLNPGAILLLHESTPIAAEVLTAVLAELKARGLKAQLPSKVDITG